MILDNSTTTVTTVGDVQENQIRIDPRNLDHIVSILSTNLYSNPEGSFLREIVSNAVDSHIEAGTKEPVVISFIRKGKEYLPTYDVVIRDYGTGLSPEKFQEIYLCIGSSTKRESNNYIGSFGIGRFSALSCADVVHITSFYNGKAYYYLMMKNGNKINIDEVSVTDTTEKNGLEVKINTSYVDRYLKELNNNLFYVPNIYVHSNFANDSILNFNNRKFTHFKSFSTGFEWKTTYGSSSENCLTIGNILYKYDFFKVSNIDYNLQRFFTKLQLRFSIGELSVTPNREQLLYDEKTIQALQNKIQDVIDELVDIAKSQQTNLTDMLRYYFKESQEPMLKLGDKYIKCGGISKISDVLSYTYKDKRIHQDDKPLWIALSHVFTYAIDNLPFVLVMKDGKILTTQQKHKYALRDISWDENKVNIVVIPNRIGVNSVYLKQYIQYKYSEYEWVFVVVKPCLTPSVLKTLSFTGNSDICVEKGYQKDILSTIWLYHQLLLSFSKYAEEVDIINSEDYVSFKEDNKIRRDMYQKTYDEIRFYISVPNAHSEKNYDTYKRDFKSLYEVDRWIKRYCKYTVLYGCLDDPLFILLDDLTKSERKKYVLLKVAKSNLRYLKVVPNNWKPIGDVINANNSKIRKLITYNQFKFPFCSDDEKIIFGLLKYIPIADSSSIYRAVGYKVSLHAESIELLNGFVKDFADNKLPYDYTLIEDLNVFKKYIDVAHKLRGIYDIEYDTGILLAYIAMKNKLIKLNDRQYQIIRKALKSIKNEDN